MSEKVAIFGTWGEPFAGFGTWALVNLEASFTTKIHFKEFQIQNSGENPSLMFNRLHCYELRDFFYDFEKYFLLFPNNCNISGHDNCRK